ncbi:MAG: PIG-L family deacetylase [Actinobacteria bacterium]|nr:PIG-L family deacetylase [Actinomycetota bacterium]
MRRLVVAPHMDDESLGCGGLLAKHPDDSGVLVLTDSGPRRRAEHEQALGILGVANSTILDFADGHLPARMTEVVAALDEYLAEHQPEEIYLPFPSLHQDHIAAYEAGMRACRISMSPDHWVPASVFVYDIAVYDVNLYPSDLRWNVFETLTEAQADTKAAACAAYVSENPSGPHPMNSIKELASAVGQVRRVAYAEQYALVRQVRP